MTLPITRDQAYSAAKWIKQNFGDKVAVATSGTPFDSDLLCGIACQETAYFWLSFIDKLSTDEVVARCVLDASGDYPGTRRSAFPVNTAAFVEMYGQEKADLLIAEANATRAIRGFGAASWVYKGYGLYQYDLQYVQDDPDFFFEKKWYDFDECLVRVVGELSEKYGESEDLWTTVKAYNGSGSAATEYANNVMQYRQYCSEV
ncbi:hypothetical protein GO286_03001 [Ralstonia solanacearum]|nr:hypothetical protein [Ralstonia solanacearum]QKL50909.1 hypothetical protein HI816_03040 [Ralstonia solanacearum]QKM22164.1 hypothetical protein HI796_03035 [Ralstonia solanacearum]QKM26972.1 hypothetical protein HI795_03040 [Ralstonia solanacearum]